MGDAVSVATDDHVGSGNRKKRLRTDWCAATGTWVNERKRAARQGYHPFVLPLLRPKLSFGVIHDAERRARQPLQRHWGKPLAVWVNFTAGAVQHAWHWRLTGAFMG